MIKALSFIFSIITLQVFGLAPFMIDGPSMEPSLESGDVIMIDELADLRGFGRGDIVVFAEEKEPDYYYVKRIVGLPGEKIHITKEGLYVEYGEGGEEKLNESYLGEGADSVPVSEGYRDNYRHSYDIPEGKYFVLGDNRLHSLDSRYFNDPFIGENEIRGKYLFKVIGL